MLLIFLMLFGMYMAYDAWYVRYVSSGSNLTAYRPSKDDPKAFLELGEECIGWITLDDTTIDYPLMQGKDNQKYLNTGPDGKYALSGSIFLDFQCDPGFNIPYSLIYGHKMAKGKMFGALSEWESRDYFNSHKTGLLTTKTQELKLKVFALVITDANENRYFDPVHTAGQYELIKENNVYFEEIPKGKRIVALATCRDPGTTLRTILFCYIED